MTEIEFNLYLLKLKECDQKYFEKGSFSNEIAIFNELHTYLECHACQRDDFADGLLAYFEEYGDFGNSVNYDIAEWLIYQDKDYYEYGDSPLKVASELSGALFLIEEEAGPVEWERTGCYWHIIAECLGYKFKDNYMSWKETVLANDLDYPYPDYTTPETRLIISEMFYDHITALDDWDKMDNIKEAMRILSISDVRKAKIKSLLGAKNKKAPEIYDRLCRNTAIALYYCYHKLGEEKKAVKELKKANIADSEMKLIVFNSFEIENPLYKKQELLAELKKKKTRTSSHPLKKKSFITRVIHKLKKILK